MLTDEYRKQIEQTIASLRRRATGGDAWAKVQLARYQGVLETEDQAGKTTSTAPPRLDPRPLTAPLPDLEHPWSRALVAASRFLVRVDFPVEDGNTSIATAIGIDRPGCFVVHPAHLKDTDWCDLTVHLDGQTYTAEVSIYKSGQPGVVLGSFDAIPELVTPRRATRSLVPGEPLLALSYDEDGLDATPGCFRAQGQGFPGTSWTGPVIECDFPEDAALYPGDALLDASGLFVGFLASGRLRPVLAYPQEVL